MRKKLALKLIAELRDYVNNGVPYSLTFKPTGKLSKEEICRLETSLKYHFEVWRDTWILPNLDNLETVIKAEKANRKNKTIDLTRRG